MTKIHFGHLYPSTLGFDRVFNTLEAMLDTVPNTCLVYLYSEVPAG